MKFQPVAEKKRSIILDTDIGPDCDDAGALAVLWRLQARYGFDVPAVINCTSNPYGCGTIRAINRYYGHGGVAVGMYEKEGFLADSSRYSPGVCEAFGEEPGGEDSLKVYRRVLTAAEDDSVILVTIGPLTTAARLLREERELFAAKIHAVVSMAARYPSGREYNVYCQAEDGSYFFNNLPEGCPCVFSDFDIGWKIFTGFTPEDEEEYGNTPVFLAYKLHTDGRLVNSSYDLTAVHFAVTGETDGMYGLTEALRCEIDTEGNNVFTPDPKGGCYCMTKLKSDEELAAYYNALLHEKP